MFFAALFTVAQTWKQPRCPSTEEWINKIWYIYTMECYSAIKRSEIMPFAETWIDLETVIQSEISQKEKNKYHMISLICGIQKHGTNELIYKAEIETEVENKFTDTKVGGKGGWDELGDWD